MRKGDCSIAEFDLENIPEDFNFDLLPKDYVLGRTTTDTTDNENSWCINNKGNRFFAMIFVDNKIGERFFTTRVNDCYWNFIDKGYSCCYDYNDVYDVIKKTAFKFYFQTSDTAVINDFAKGECSEYCDSMNVQNDSEIHFDLILVKEYIFAYEDYDDKEAIVFGDVCLDDVFAGGRYYKRIIPLISNTGVPDLSHDEELYLKGELDLIDLIEWTEWS